jgi:peptide/nickel transport system substrate-binding protein
MKRIALTLIIALLALPAIAMAKSDLVVVTDAPPKSMNPHAFSSDANLSYMSNFFDGLLQRPAPDGKLAPALAVKWERLDAVTWKFELRKGVKFHNGNTFNAADVKFTFERMKDPKYSKLLNIANSIASIETPDDYTVIFKNVKPVPWFAETMHQNFIVDMESSKGRDDGDYNTKPIGTGAYKFVEWVKGSYVRMAANETYWEGAPKYKTVDIRPITEEATRFAALAGKQADIVNGVPVSLIERIEKMPHVE